MTKTRSTKRALLMSALSLLMCVSMLIGSTFAWFTDSVTSSGNKIVAGTLDVQLLMNTGDGYKDISDNANPIFGEGSIAQNNNAETLWEPGKTQVAYLAIKNNGSLALKYTVGLDVQNVSKDLYKVMQYAITPDAQYNSVTDWSGNGNNVVVGTQSVSESVSLGVGETHYFALSIHMDEAAGNEYQGGEVNFDLTVLATQNTVESDSFDNQYDANADYDGEISNVTSLVAAMKNGGTYKLTSDIDVDETINIPAGVEVTLNLNGMTIDYNAESGSIIRSEGDLTLVGEGKINSTAPSYAIRAQSGSLTVDSNDIEVVGTFGAISMFNGAEVTVNGGSYTATGVAGKTHHCVYVGTGANLVINDGTFAHNGAGTSDSGATLTVYAGANGGATINGGTFTGSGSYITAFAKYDSSCYLTINGGTFTTNPSNYVGSGYTANNNGDGTYTVLPEGTVIVEDADDIVAAATDGKAAYIPANSTVSVDMTGLSVNGAVAKTSKGVLYNAGTLTIANGNVTSEAENGGSALYNVGTMTVEGGIYTGATQSGGSWPSYAVNNYGDMTMTDAVVNSTHGGLASCSGNSLTLNDVTVTTTGFGGSSHTLYTTGAGSSIVVNGGTYTHKGNGDGSVAYIGSGTSLTVNGGVFKAEGGAYGIAALGDITVNGGEFYNKFQAWGGTIIVKGGTFHFDPTAWVADGYSATNNGNGTWTVAAN